MCRKLCHLIWGIWWLHRSKMLKLRRQESQPFGSGWAANIAGIHSWTFRLPWSDLLWEKFRNILFHSTFSNFQTGHLKLGTIFEKKELKKMDIKNFCHNFGHTSIRWEICVCKEASWVSFLSKLSDKLLWKMDW